MVYDIENHDMVAQSLLQSHADVCYPIVDKPSQLLQSFSKAKHCLKGMYGSLGLANSHIDTKIVVANYEMIWPI